MMRNVLQHDRPNPVTMPGYWNYQALRPLLHRDGDLTPVEKVERCVLVLSGPGRGAGAMQLLPGKAAPAHVHAPSAVRIIVEGKTTIDGENIDWGDKDTFTAPVFAKITHETEEDSFLIRVHDRPLQEKLGYYEERAR